MTDLLLKREKAVLIEVGNMQLMPQCFRCKHLHGDESRMTCDAFPEGIPDELVHDTRDHKKPFTGDNGIRFEPIDD